MKILVQNYPKIPNDNTSPNFRSAKIQSFLQKEFTTISSNNSSTKDIFVKLAAISGLASIIAWVNALKTNEDGETLTKLGTIEENWENKANERFLSPETQQNYLDFVSRADEVESLLWTKAFFDKASSISEADSTVISDDAKNFFLSPETNEVFMMSSAEKKIRTLLNQLNILIKANNEVRLNALKSIESKLNKLVQQAINFQNSEQTTKLYEKFANIVRAFAITNFVSMNTSSAKAELPLEEVDDSKKYISVKPTAVTEPSSEIRETASTERDGVKVAGDEIKEIEESVDDTVENTEKSPVGMSSIKVLGKIDVVPDGVSRFKPSTKAIETETLKPLPITEENKEFINEVFVPNFNRTARVKPEIYSDYMDIIQKIYNAYPEDKKTLRAQFLKRLKIEDITSYLKLYQEYTEEKLASIDFLCFMDLELVKRAHDGSLTKEEFAKLNHLKKTLVMYYKLTGGVDQDITIAFVDGVSFNQRLEIIRDFHKIIYNIPDENLYKMSSAELITAESVREEIINKIIHNIDDYRNIVAFLDIDVTDIENELKKGDIEEAKIVAREILNRSEAKKKIEKFTDLVSNKAFDDIAGGIHARMRFLERMVFNNPSNLSLGNYELKKITSKAVLLLKKQIEKVRTINIINYPARKRGDKNENKYGPRVFLKDYTIGLNDSAMVHTIF